MCLILFALHAHTHYPLVVAANRDESYARPTRSAHFWEDHPQLFAGRDKLAGGTWMGITKQGRFAAVTNFREPLTTPTGNNLSLLSRGELTTNYLTRHIDAKEYLTTVASNKHRYAGFNLLLGNEKQLWYYSNQISHTQALTPGIYGLSNGLLNEPWPKIKSGKRALKTLLSQTIDPAQLLAMMQDTTAAEDSDLPDTGVGVEYERLLSSRFIRTEKYGTRASTVLLIDKRGEVIVWEKNTMPGNTNNAIEKVQFTVLD